MKELLVLNIFAIIGFLWLAFVMPPSSDVDARMRFTELHREGVINEEALSRFHPSRNFAQNPRSNVPRYICEPYHESMKLAAFAGLVLSIVNSPFLTVLILIRRRQKRAPAVQRG